MVVAGFFIGNLTKNVKLKEKMPKNCETLSKCMKIWGKKWKKFVEKYRNLAESVKIWGKKLQFPLFPIEYGSKIVIVISSYHRSCWSKEDKTARVASCSQIVLEVLSIVGC